ncbi:HypC/HybG/HupF family hydrogenase formation chaperone [Novosphingobium decolorationis]|uniref:HypC/HybG/HupF family hydrogenase formation chaperone n=1 Tax=Novosphingobium decolorationis TaxID=2698673 RepID=A0ABX8EAE9_9SPHN|nr:HypC/HybG/HupF family hydrogenase formation chaperone [Novosphingobium decolorationis]MED5543878.1 HypC/HybG/HupF family hydrogenase formation chaperone [Pseudomonadota bacterium]QVM85136.1 HypC/HybG/HupF family hydrogenase formation chaperone [Novosphingobium decolorationis]
MCLAIPALVTAVLADDMATVSLGGVVKTVSVALLDEVAVGDYVLLHVGYALHKISEEEAERTLAMMAEGGLLEAELDEIAGDAA